MKEQDKFWPGWIAHASSFCTAKWSLKKWSSGVQSCGIVQGCEHEGTGRQKPLKQHELNRSCFLAICLICSLRLCFKWNHLRCFLWETDYFSWTNATSQQDINRVLSVPLLILYHFSYCDSKGSTPTRKKSTLSISCPNYRQRLVTLQGMLFSLLMTWSCPQKEIHFERSWIEMKMNKPKYMFWNNYIYAYTHTHTHKQTICYFARTNMLSQNLINPTVLFHYLIKN